MASFFWDSIATYLKKKIILNDLNIFLSQNSFCAEWIISLLEKLIFLAS